MKQKYPGITRLHIGVSNICNHRCSFCFIKDYSIILDPIVWKDRLADLYPQLTDIMLAGGEPTVTPYVKEFNNYVISLNPKIRFEMFTNGHRFDEYWDNLFVERGNWINFSINAATKETYDRLTIGGDWSMLLNNIKRLRSKVPPFHKMKFGASIVLCEKNYKESADFIKLCSDLGFTHVSFFFDSCVKKVTIFDPEETNKALREAEKHKNMHIWGLERFKQYTEDIPRPGHICETVDYNLYVDIDGNVRYCCLIISPSGIMGNLKKNTLEEILSTPWAKELKSNIKNGDLSTCSVYCTPITKGINNAN